MVLHAAALDVAEVLAHRIGLQQVGVVSDDRDRRVKLSALAQRLGGADLGDGQRGEFVSMVDERLMKLLETTDPQLGVGGPVRGVEGTPRPCDRRFRVGNFGVGGVAEHLAGGGVERGKRP